MQVVVVVLEKLPQVQVAQVEVVLEEVLVLVLAHLAVQQILVVAVVAHIILTACLQVTAAQAS
jgi:hypothetical protein